MNFSEYSDKWERQILSMKKPATQSSFRSHLRRANKHFANLPLAAITENLAQEHISHAAKELSPKAVLNYWGTIRLVLSRAVKEGLIPRVPEPELPKPFKTNQPCLTAAKIREIIQKSEGIYKTFFLTLAETGCRVSEVLALKREDVNAEKRTISISKSIFKGKLQQPKTANSIRTLSISRWLCERMLRHRGDFIFRYSRKTACTTSSFNTQLRKLAGDVGFHAFRRGNSLILAELGAPSYIIKKRLGHAGDVTDGYIQFPEGFDREWAEKISNVIGG